MSIIAVQPLLVGAVLLWAANVKLFSRRGAIAARDAALARLVGEKRAPAAYRILGAAEAVVGLALLVPILWAPATVAAIALSAGFCGYLAYARVAAPESSCGCLGGKGAAISWRAFARSGGMLAASVTILWTDMAWPTALAQHPASSLGVVAVEAALFLTVSAEFDGAWLVPLRRWRARWSRPLGGDTGEVPLDATVERMQRSDVFRHVAKLLRSDVRETWDEDDWRIVCYGAMVDGRRATAVFAVPLLRDAPDEVRVAFVDDKTSQTLLHFNSPPEEDERPEWAMPKSATMAG
ncbi:MauE/DoxX family redox-associated membrane protein [Stackebrandtia nassauensis]|uniref:Methylamine utilisation protein MauE domain-containing protein n=1 Tax=Stackebrandtia nassauensis (strain DSM 44728 / CIP 108903 / NRRL B-16338 / NBRC 102104 / LLR-40K-21) TaxID=446470 RepID=D3QAA4_STANL|nr:MauE/DoxX family redox-associated membrane protein [Stackebrandtia nassauensis]ADD40816.1 hypothetical protein Snas_1106 [Stackebrandtia nassauensis DSM 44728]